MALINCSECGRRVSDRASSCPHCGNPISAAREPASGMPVNGDTPGPQQAATASAGDNAPLQFRQSKAERNARRSPWPALLLVCALLAGVAWFAYRHLPTGPGAENEDYALDSKGYIASIGPAFFDKPKSLLLVDDTTGKALTGNSYEFRIGGGEMTLCTTAGQCSASGPVNEERLTNGTQCKGIATTAPAHGLAKRFYVVCVSPVPVKQFILPEGDRPGEIPANMPYMSIVSQSSNGSVLTVNARMVVKGDTTAQGMAAPAQTAVAPVEDKCAIIDRGEAQTRRDCQGGNFNACRDIQGWIANRIMEGCATTRAAPQAVDPPPSQPGAEGLSAEQDKPAQDHDVTPPADNAAPEQSPGSTDITIRSSPAPRYPPTAFRAGIEGVVRVRVDVDAQGYPTDVSVETSSGNSDLDRAAKEAARRWTFNPATIDGMPARGRIVVPVTFALN